MKHTGESVCSQHDIYLNHLSHINVTYYTLHQCHLLHIYVTYHTPHQMPLKTHQCHLSNTTPNVTYPRSILLITHQYYLSHIIVLTFLLLQVSVWFDNSQFTLHTKRFNRNNACGFETVIFLNNALFGLNIISQCKGQTHDW